MPKACNQVWTIDFKGHFRTADGRLCYPLTVRDLHSRFVLAIIVLLDPSEKTVKKALVRVFRRWGLPEIFRVDNGAPFGSCGPRGLTTLSVWWLRLGIGVEFTGRARPQDNAAHEQMHRVLKAETASPPGAHPQAQQRRFQRWIACYNYLRPHESLGQKPPATCYHRSQRPWPAALADWSYGKSWPRRRIHSKGLLSWQGRRRNIGRAFTGEWIGLKPLSAGVWRVYLGKYLLGTLHAVDAAGLRPVQLLANRKKC
ncbi:MAG: transposase [Anaerolineales bacterium]